MSELEEEYNSIIEIFESSKVFGRIFHKRAGGRGFVFDIKKNKYKIHFYIFMIYDKIVFIIEKWNVDKDIYNKSIFNLEEFLECLSDEQKKIIIFNLDLFKKYF